MNSESFSYTPSYSVVVLGGGEEIFSSSSSSISGLSWPLLLAAKDTQGCIATDQNHTLTNLMITRPTTTFVLRPRLHLDQRLLSKLFELGHFD